MFLLLCQIFLFFSLWCHSSHMTKKVSNPEIPLKSVSISQKAMLPGTVFHFRNKIVMYFCLQLLELGPT